MSENQIVKLHIKIKKRTKEGKSPVLMKKEVKRRSITYKNVRKKEYQSSKTK